MNKKAKPIEIDSKEQEKKPKVLVIYVHPYPQDSVANAEMIQRISSLEHVTVHDLYGEYPNFFIDIVREQTLVNEHDIIVFQHPLYMYSCPALMKEWLDVVLGQGFAYGQSGDALMGKYWRSVITTGGAKTAFTSSGYNRYSLDEILQPFELTAALCRMEWLPPLVLYWARSVGKEEREIHCENYYQWLDNPLFIAGGLS